MGLREDIRNYRPQRPPQGRGGHNQDQWERPPVTGEERERNHWRLKVLAEWQANGKLNEKDERGEYLYTVQDCKAEAARRQAEQQSGDFNERS